MVFLRASLSADPAYEVRGEGLVLRPPTLADFESWAALRAQSKAHLVPFEPQWSHDELSRGAFRRRLRQQAREYDADTGYAFHIFLDRRDMLVGGLTLSNVRRGVASAASLGYWVGLPFAGQGVMTRAVQAVLPFAFGRLGLHRIEAACLPNNRASMRVLEKTGFRREGVARGYLRINGLWQDHVLHAALSDDGAVAGGES
jgi:ribosomal-protein-alanine N-acetyltransferase